MTLFEEIREAWYSAHASRIERPEQILGALVKPHRERLAAVGDE